MKRKGNSLLQEPAGRSLPGELLLFGILSLSLLMFHLWGKIEIDFQIHENTRLENQVDSLWHRIDDLQISVSRLRSVNRIQEMARDLGMVPLSGSDKEDLAVDLEGLNAGTVFRADEMWMAGFSPFDLKKKSTE